MKTNKVIIKLTVVNTKRIGYTGAMLERFFNETLMLRTARKIGDEETVNHYVLGKLNDCKAYGGIDFEVIEYPRIEKVDSEQFNEDMNKVADLLNDYPLEMMETIWDWFYNASRDKFLFSEQSYYYFLYDMANYDLLLVDNGRVDIEHSNHKELAEIVAKYASENNCRVVENRLYNK